LCEVPLILDDEELLAVRKHGALPRGAPLSEVAHIIRQALMAEMSRVSVPWSHLPEPVSTWLQGEAATLQNFIDELPRDLRNRELLERRVREFANALESLSTAQRECFVLGLADLNRNALRLLVAQAEAV